MMDEQLKKIGIITLLVGAALAAQAEEQRFTPTSDGKSYDLAERESMNWNSSGMAGQMRTAFFSNEGVAERIKVVHEIVKKLDQYSDWDKDGGPEPRKCSPD